MAPKSLATNLPKLWINIQQGPPKNLKAIKNYYIATGLASSAITTYGGSGDEDIVKKLNFETCAINIYNELDSLKKVFIPNLRAKLNKDSNSWPRTVKGIDDLLDDVNEIYKEFYNVSGLDLDYKYVVALLRGQMLAVQNGVKGSIIPPNEISVEQYVDYVRVHVNCSKSSSILTENQDTLKVDVLHTSLCEPMLIPIFHNTLKFNSVNIYIHSPWGCENSHLAEFDSQWD